MKKTTNNKTNTKLSFKRMITIDQTFKLILLLVSIFFTSRNGYSQLNPNFGNNGLTRTNLFSNFGTGSADIIYDMKILSNGSILVAGRSGAPSTASGLSFAAARYTSSGSLDNTFGITNFNPPGTYFYAPGKDAEAYKMALQADGKILMVGYAVNTSTLNKELAILRLNANGTLDNSFGNNGITLLWGQFGISGNSHQITGKGIAIYPDGKILLAAELDFWNDKKIILCRLNSNGSLDNTFGTNSNKEYSFRTGLKMETVTELIYNSGDGYFYMSGYLDDQNISNSSQAFIAKLDNDGNLISTFGNNGVFEFKTTTSKITTFNRFVIRNSDLYACGKLQSQGNNKDFFLAVNLKLNGDLNNTFNDSGFVVHEFNNNSAYSEAIAIDNDGNLVLTGSATNASFQSDLAVLKLSPTGSVLNSLIYNLGSQFAEIGYSVGILSNNNILVAGRYDGAIPAERADFFVAEINASFTTSMKNFNNNVQYSLYPNPNNGIFTIETNKTGYFDVIDLSGKILNSFNINNPTERVQLNQPKGIYFIREKETQRMHKVIIE